MHTLPPKSEDGDASPLSQPEHVSSLLSLFYSITHIHTHLLVKFI